jgi:hypothetical protein
MIGILKNLNKLKLSRQRIILKYEPILDKIDLILFSKIILKYEPILD